jgi:phage terminase small subunit
MNAKTKLKLPEGLTPRSENFWKRVQGEYSIEDGAGLRILEEACRALDRASEAADILKEQGLILVDRWQQKRPHPALKIEADSRSGFLACMRLLALDGTGELNGGK